MADELDAAFGTDNNGELADLRRDYGDFVIVHTLDGRWSAFSVVIGHAEQLVADSAAELRTRMDDERTRIRLDRMRGEGGAWTS